MRKNIIAMTAVTVMADRAEYTVTVQYPDLGIITKTPWQGSSTPGHPGPVMFQAEAGNWVHIDSPDRFGDTFGHAWLDNFYA